MLLANHAPCPTQGVRHRVLLLLLLLWRRQRNGRPQSQSTVKFPFLFTQFYCEPRELSCITTTWTDPRLNLNEKERERTETTRSSKTENTKGTLLSPHLIFGYFAIFHFIKHFLRICHINLLERVKTVISQSQGGWLYPKKTNKFLISRTRLKGSRFGIWVGVGVGCHVKSMSGLAWPYLPNLLTWCQHPLFPLPISLFHFPFFP